MTDDTKGKVAGQTVSVLQNHSVCDEQSRNGEHLQQTAIQTITQTIQINTNTPEGVYGLFCTREHKELATMLKMDRREYIFYIIQTLKKNYNPPAH